MHREEILGIPNRCTSGCALEPHQSLCQLLLPDTNVLKTPPEDHTTTLKQTVLWSPRMGKYISATLRDTGNVSHFKYIAIKILSAHLIFHNKKFNFKKVPSTVSRTQKAFIYILIYENARPESYSQLKNSYDLLKI